MNTVANRGLVVVRRARRPLVDPALEAGQVRLGDICIANELVHLTADHLRRVGRVFPVLLLELVDEDVLQLLALLDVHQALPPLVIELRVDLGDLYTESGQALQGSFSVESKPTFASKYSCESSRRDLHNTLLCTAPISIFSNVFV